MAETETFSRSELVRIAGVDDDAVAFWLRSNLLLPEDRGARKHRRFTRREVRIAAVLRELRNIGLNVSAMAGLIGQLRLAQVEWDRLKEALGSERWIFEVAGGWDPDDRDCSGLIAYGHMTLEEAELVYSLQEGMTKEIYSKVSLASDFEEQPGATTLQCAAKNADGSWSWIGPPSGVDIDAMAAIVLNLGRILNLHWPEGAKE